MENQVSLERLIQHVANLLKKRIISHSSTHLYFLENNEAFFVSQDNCIEMKKNCRERYWVEYLRTRIELINSNSINAKFEFKDDLLKVVKLSAPGGHYFNATLNSNSIYLYSYITLYKTRELCVVVGEDVPDIQEKLKTKISRWIADISIS